MTKGSEGQYLYGVWLLSQEREGKVFYSHVDGLGSAHLLTDEEANPKDRYNYEAFGELLASAGRTSNEYSLVITRGHSHQKPEKMMIGNLLCGA